MTLIKVLNKVIKLMFSSKTLLFVTIVFLSNQHCRLVAY